AMLDRADTASTVAGACGQIAAANRTYEDAVRLVQALGPEYPRHEHVHTRLVALKARLLRSAARFWMGAAAHLRRRRIGRPRRSSAAIPECSRCPLVATRGSACGCPRSRSSVRFAKRLRCRAPQQAIAGARQREVWIQPTESSAVSRCRGEVRRRP